MTDKQIIISRVLRFMDHFAKEDSQGLNYSQTYRFNAYMKPSKGSADCSSLVAMAFAAAGYPLIDSKGNELWVSCYEVYAGGFDLVYPDTKSLIGKLLPDTNVEESALKAKVLSQYEEGDIVFDNFNRGTSRSNKITHVRLIDTDAKNIIHIANNREKCCRVPITWGATHVCAIIRLSDCVALPALPILVDGSANIFVRTLQLLLNMEAGRPMLKVDGQFGAKTRVALNSYKATKSLAQNGKCDAAVWRRLLPIPEDEVVEPEPEDDVEFEDKQVEVIGGSVYVRSEPGLYGNKLGVVKTNTRLVCTGIADSGWYKILYGGSEGYISNLDTLTKLINTQFVKVLGASVWVRSIGSKSGTRLGTAKAGEVYTLYKVSSTGWYQIRFDDRIGYISNRSDLTKIVE